MLGKASSPMLEQAEQGIEAKITPQLKGAFTKVINAGLTIMYSPKLAQVRAQHMNQSQNPAQDAGQGAVRLVSNLYQQSNKTMPKALIVPAAMIFAFEYLDLVSKAGKVEVTPALIAQTAKDTADALLPMLGATPDKIQQLQAMRQQQAAPAPAGIINQASQGA